MAANFVLGCQIKAYTGAILKNMWLSVHNESRGSAHHSSWPALLSGCDFITAFLYARLISSPVASGHTPCVSDKVAIGPPILNHVANHRSMQQKAHHDPPRRSAACFKLVDATKSVINTPRRLFCPASDTNTVRGGNGILSRVDADDSRAVPLAEPANGRQGVSRSEFHNYKSRDRWYPGN